VNGSTSWWSDDPIATFQEDRLQRRPFAKQVAAVLDEVGQASATSTVIAVTGPWGSGKTSILKLATAHLRLGTWRKTWFNPWALSGPDAVTHELIASIASVMPSDRPSKRIKKALYEYGDYAAPLLSFVPGGDVVNTWHQVASGRNSGNSLVRMAEDLTRRLEESPHRILIIIDDLDRLQPEELLALFKSIRVLGRLPNVHYLLAFDQDTLINVLKQTSFAHEDEARALAFLEKMVTVRLDQPPVREEQADELLVRALARALAHSSVTMTEDQTRRLVQEREELLVPLLTEPRKITRYAAQLHSYLPLVGAEELDLVDFLVLSYIRLAFPRLYLAIADDRDVLTSQVEAADAKWADSQYLRNLIGTTIRNPDRTCNRLYSAVVRLFPEIAGTDSVMHLEREQRRRDRRVSDPDYVARYFALNSEAEQISDATLTSALKRWASGDTAAESREVLDALAARDSSQTVSRVMRRLTARVMDLDDAQCGPVVAFIIEQGRVLAGTATTRDMTPTLVANLIARLPSDMLQEDDDVHDAIAKTLSNSVAFPAGEASTVRARADYDATRWPFTTLVAALRQTTWKPGARGESDQQFVDRIAALCLTTAWEIVEHDLRAGDGAPLNGAGVALRLLDETWGPSALDRRLLSLLNSGAELDALAARYVDVGTDVGDDRQVLVSFNADEFAARFGRSLVEAARERLVATQSRGTNDEDDISWSNRRAVAAGHLVRWLNSTLHRPATVTPLVRLKDRSMTDLSGSFVPTGGANLPDLQLAVGFHFGGPPGVEAPSLGQPTDEREARFLELARRSKLNGWLEAIRPTWRLERIGDWAITDGHPSLWTQVEREADGQRDGSPPLFPIRTRMKCDVGSKDPHSPPSIQLAALVEFRMSGLEASRQRASRTFDDKPLPAALTVAELFDVLVALLDTRDAARELWSSLSSGVEVPTHDETQIVMWARGGMSRSIDLRQYPFAHATEHSLYSITYAATRNDIVSGAWSQDPSNGQAAAAAIKEWAELEGHRGLDEDLVKLENRRPS
jgi:hypothetical protein